MIELGVNIDHIATLRQARKEGIPDIFEAALTAEKAGADAITVHLREDRRHIQDEDVLLLQKEIKTRLNLEMACSPEITDIACRVRPCSVCLVPEKRKELTTEGGLNVIKEFDKVSATVKRLKDAGIKVSIFIEADPDQIKVAAQTGAQMIELHTGTYANAQASDVRKKELSRLLLGDQIAYSLGLQVNAGHGLDYDNITPVIGLPHLAEVNIGFSIIARALFIGLHDAVSQMKILLA